MDIEELIPIPRNFIEDPIALEDVVEKLLKTKIDSEEDMFDFIKAQQKIVHFTITPIKLLYIYRNMISEGKIQRNKHYEQFMISKRVRSASGVMVVTVVTSPWPKTVEETYGPEVEGEVHKSNPFQKPDFTQKLSKQHKKFSCKFDCFYCPAEPGQPRSYIKREPAVARSNHHRFDAVAQFRDRGTTYLINGHHFDKVELIVLGGTWSSYPADYQEDFIRDLYYAANTFYNKDFETNPRDRFSVEEEIRINETSFCRIIGLTLETRPDEINAPELIRFRRFGVTRVQLGIQHTDDGILKYVNRGCTTNDAISAIKLLKDSCFKVDIHLMPDLPSSTPEKDRIMFETILNSPDLQADQMKIYPCAVVPWTKISIWYQNYKEGYDTHRNPKGLSKVDNRIYQPYAETQLDNIKIQVSKKVTILSSPLIELLIDFKSQIHPWIRINRLVRDIPGLYISGGTERENLRQVIHNEMKNRGLTCKCIRCREVKNKKTDIDKVILMVREYPASGGTEYFLSFESPDQSIIYGFLRLRISLGSGKQTFPELKNTALMRELHVYGTVVPVNKKNDTISGESSQHMGFGKKLIKKAEEITINHGLNRIAVIAGVGVRNYYRKQGYLDTGYQYQGWFQIKNLDDIDLVNIKADIIPHVYIRPPAPISLHKNDPLTKYLLQYLLQYKYHILSFILLFIILFIL